MGRLFAPKYYGDFECIKGDCRHSCCIGWEIDVDAVAMSRYSSLSGEMGNAIRESISDTDPPHFVLKENGRCPHLSDCGLCNIISEIGDEYLCDICRLHPRFFNDTAGGREVGLGMSCEEACRIILSSDGYTDMIEIGESDCEEISFDIRPLRREALSILYDRQIPYPERLKRLCSRFGVSPSMLSDEEWRDVLNSLEYLDGAHRDLFIGYSSEYCDTEFSLMLERALAYFIYRHASSAVDELEFRTGLGLALFCERLLASVADGCISDSDFCECARIISEEIEYSADNTDSIRAEFEFLL